MDKKLISDRINKLSLINDMCNLVAQFLVHTDYTEIKKKPITTTVSGKPVGAVQAIASSIKLGTSDIQFITSKTTYKCDSILAFFKVTSQSLLHDITEIYQNAANSSLGDEFITAIDEIANETLSIVVMFTNKLLTSLEMSVKGYEPEILSIEESLIEDTLHFKTCHELSYIESTVPHDMNKPYEAYKRDLLNNYSDMLTNLKDFFSNNTEVIPAMSAYCKVKKNQLEKPIYIETEVKLKKPKLPDAVIDVLDKTGFDKLVNTPLDFTKERMVMYADSKAIAKLEIPNVHTPWEEYKVDHKILTKDSLEAATELADSEVKISPEINNLIPRIVMDNQSIKFEMVDITQERVTESAKQTTGDTVFYKGIEYTKEEFLKKIAEEEKNGRA